MAVDPAVPADLLELHLELEAQGLSAEDLGGVAPRQGREPLVAAPAIETSVDPGEDD